MIRAALAAFSFAVLGCTDLTDPPASDPAKDTFAASLGVNLAQMTKVSPDLYTQDLIVGTGAFVFEDDSVTVLYTGWLANGTKFDGTVGSTPSPQFKLAFGSLIDGWVIGVPGMKVGGKRRLVIGSALGYGQTGSGPIPANSTLVFDVQVVTRK